MTNISNIIVGFSTQGAEKVISDTNAVAQALKDTEAQRRYGDIVRRNQAQNEKAASDKIIKSTEAETRATNENTRAKQENAKASDQGSNKERTSNSGGAKSKKPGLKGPAAILSAAVVAFNEFVDSVSEKSNKATAEITKLSKVLSIPRSEAATLRNEFGKLAESIPEDINEITQAFHKLRQNGLDPSLGAISDYSEISSGLDTDGGLNTVLDALAAATTKNDFSKLEELGFTIEEEGENVTLAIGDFRKKIKNESVAIEQTVREISQKEFFGGNARIANTSAGSTDRLKEQSSEFLGSLPKLTGEIEYSSHEQRDSKKVSSDTKISSDEIERQKIYSELNEELKHKVKNLKEEKGFLSSVKNYFSDFLGNLKHKNETGVTQAQGSLSTLMIGRDRRDSFHTREIQDGVIKKARSDVGDAREIYEKEKNNTDIPLQQRVNYDAGSEYRLDYVENESKASNDPEAISKLQESIKDALDVTPPWLKDLSVFGTQLSPNNSDQNNNKTIEDAQKTSDQINDIDKKTTNEHETELDQRRDNQEQSNSERLEKESEHSSAIGDIYQETTNNIKDRYKEQEDELATKQNNDLATLEHSLKLEEDKVTQSYQRRLQIINDNTPEGSEKRDKLTDRVTSEFEEDMNRLAEQFVRENEFTSASRDEQITMLEDFYNTRHEKIMAMTELTEQEKTDLLEKSAKARDARLQTLQKTDAKMTAQNYDKLFGSLLSITKDFGGEQSKLYKAFFLMSKRSAIQEAIVNIQKAISQAAAVGPPPFNLAAIATVAASTASIIGTIRSTTLDLAGAFDHGGMIPSGQQGLVGEFGPELISGPAVITSRRTTADKGNEEMRDGKKVVHLNLNFDLRNADRNTVDDLRDASEQIKEDVMNTLIEDGFSNGNVSQAFRTGS